MEDQPFFPLMSRNARDDKNGRFGERAPQLTMLAKLAILATSCQFRQISCHPLVLTAVG